MAQFSVGQTDYIQVLNQQLPAYGQIAFPATQVPSSDANTLDDYEEGTFTPTFTFSTPGNLAITYSTRTADYTKIGREIIARFAVASSAFTHTTASGSAQVTGFPISASADSGYVYNGQVQWQGITKANYTDYVCRMNSSASMLIFIASGSGQANATLGTSDMPTGGSIGLSGFISYRA